MRPCLPVSFDQGLHWIASKRTACVRALSGGCFPPIRRKPRASDLTT